MRPDAVAHESLTNARALYNLLWRMVLRNSEDVLNGPSWWASCHLWGVGRGQGCWYVPPGEQASRLK